jgi:hypothetical protein
MKSNRLRHIVVNETNYDALSRLGTFGQSFNDVLTQLLTEKKLNQQTGLLVRDPVVQPAVDLLATQESESRRE